MLSTFSYRMHIIIPNVEIVGMLHYRKEKFEIGEDLQVQRRPRHHVDPNAIACVQSESNKKFSLLFLLFSVKG